MGWRKAGREADGQMDSQTSDRGTEERAQCGCSAAISYELTVLSRHQEGGLGKLSKLTRTEVLHAPTPQGEDETACHAGVPGMQPW